MKAGCMGFLCVAGTIAWVLIKHPEYTKILLYAGGMLLGGFLILFFIWYGLVTIRCIFRF